MVQSLHDRRRRVGRLTLENTAPSHIAAWSHLGHFYEQKDPCIITRVKEDLPILQRYPGSASKSKWSYPLPNGTYMTMEHHGLLARRGDFGLASITDPSTKTRYERVDFPILDAGEQEWGSWNGKLKQYEIYDIMSFLSKFFLDDERGVTPKPIYEYAQTMYMEIRKFIYAKSGTWFESTWYGRPFRGHEGLCTMEDLLSMPMFQTFVSSEIPADAHLFSLNT